MFDHVKFGVRDYARSRAFYLKALAPLGITVVHEAANGIELAGAGEPSLCFFQTDERPAHLHLAFSAQSRDQVDAFHRAALEAGAQDNGAPGLRPRYHPGYYAAFVIDPDGHNLEAVFQDRQPSVNHPNA
jgi:catechol 2,3-dioxygenase-like lactoylglutathione lyase family enzyme